MIDVERRQGIATVRIDDGAVNALTQALCDAIAQTLEDLGGHVETRAVVLTGNDRAFSAGVDLRPLVSADEDALRGFLASLDRCFTAVIDCTAPTVAAINGHALAGGCVLAMGCDYRVAAATDAGIGLTELQVGVPFPTTAIEIMRWRVGEARLGRLVWAAQPTPLRDAVDDGLADEVRPPASLAERADELARWLADLPAATAQLTKTQLQADLRERLARRGDDWESRVRASWTSVEVLDSMQTFLDGLSRRDR